MTQSPFIISTRPLEDANADCHTLIEAGLEALTAPMMRIEPRAFAAPPNNNVDDDTEAYILTSRHAAPLLAKHATLNKPCFVVGEATETAAKKAGFQDIIQNIRGGTDDSASLLALINASPYQKFCWASGAHISLDLTANSSKHITRLIVYQAVLESHLDAKICARIASGAPCFVLVHAGRAGAQFSHLITEHKLDAYRPLMQLIALSPRIAGLSGQAWHKIHIVPAPHHALMLEAARTLGKHKNG